MILVVGMLGFIAWTLYAGPDVSWDFLNYHLYVGLHASGDSLSRDFFPASGSSYLAPYAYWPMAAMIAMKWPAMVVGALMAALHSVAVVTTWYLSKQLFPGATRKAIGLRAAATALGVICPLVLAQVGTSFIDLTTAIPCVAGIALMLNGLNTLNAPRSGVRTLMFSGLCFGVATALKLTNAPFALAAFLSLAVVWCIRADLKWRILFFYGSAEILGLLAGYGVWGYQLWREFGNPLFPFLNSVFQVSAPQIADVNAPRQIMGAAILDWMQNVRSGLHQRYLPHTIWEWLLRPLYMVDPVANVYAEVRAPDARLLALFCLAPFAIWKSRKAVDRSSFLPLFIFFLIGWTLWMALFGNGRYLMPLLLVAGPALVACYDLCWTSRGSVGLGAATVFLCVQAALLWEGAPFRWGQSAWHGQWISAELPLEVTDHPITFVTLDLLSVSWLSAFVHPGSQFVNPMGQDAMTGSGPGLDRYARLLRESSEVLVVFRFGLVEPKTGKPFPPSPSGRQLSAAQNGLKVDFNACLTGKLGETSPLGVAMTVTNSQGVDRKAVVGFFFCNAHYEPQVRSQLHLDPLNESVFNKIENACPHLYFPKGTKTTCSAQLCWRSYTGSDTHLFIDDGGKVSTHHYGGVDDPELGTAMELSQDNSAIACHEELGRYVPWSPGANLFSRHPGAE